ncbi:hypothetical protein VC83_07299 [Pseudogymnoascus destructans]|uniref:EXPERA domain-containing protein n=2 Tax=Pseudogymnoascus destructans TaxID=655981 RepID=L8FQV3_PSED2|nr:uncharacterized protein VC83_07299 [Pseudogymnoascus destructans]ELR03292.1 hypothetical protein GMDG_06040 [Pseudogymnoascus destructans 20631-21]OAF56551.1 hypothetical protein VC83_07299 [Pseudogymnoascus destructans]
MAFGIISNLTNPLITDHPYYPIEVEIASYLANEWSVPVLLAAFGGVCATVLLIAQIVVDKLHSNLRTSEKITIWWFVLSGCIHLFFEGYFSVNHTLMGPKQDLFGQLWKEYSLSDSRYLTSDPFVLCMETITAFLWGPLCFIIAGLITTSHPLRHPLQIIVSTGQVYGCILYYATSMFDHYYKGVVYSRPEFLYFWCYYFLMNFFWIMIPSTLVVSSVNQIAIAFRALDSTSAKATKGKKGQ